MNRPVKFLHIFDDEKITRTTIDLFKKLEEYEQTFVIISEGEREKPENYSPPDSVQILNKSAELTSRLREMIESHDVIFFQALSYEKAKVLSNIKANKKIFIWGLWGFELYNIVDYFGDFKDSNISTTKKEKSLKSRIRDFYTFNFIYRRAVKKLDICLFLLESDFDLLSKFIRHDAIWMTACYQTAENIHGIKNDFEVAGNSILLGNSSTPSNKHAQVFDILKAYDLGDRSLIAPLSYGDDEYREEIIKLGKENFGENFKPLTSFFDIDSYLEEIKNCAHVIMAHERQQGFGSIIMMLLGGSKVYLSNAGPLYSWFKDLDVVIFCVEKDLPDELDEPLNDEEKEHNKKILTGYLSEEIVLVRLKMIFEKAASLFLSKAK